MNSYNYSYNVLINRLEAFAAGHLLIKRFTHGQIDLADMDQDEQYPFMHVVPNNIKPVDGGMQFDFQIIFADIPRDKETKAEYQREVISDCVRLAQDLIAEVKNGLQLFGFDVQLVTPPVIEPFMEEYKNTLTGVTFSLQLEVPWDWSACDIPAVWAVGGSSSGGSGSPIGIVLRTNGVDNAVQNILDLVAGTNITITDNGDGSVTFDAAGGGGGGGPYVSTEFNANHATALGNQYVIGDRVWYNGSVYACIANNDGINPTNPSYWTLQAVGYRLRQTPVDWNASSGDYQILNKPTLATVATTGDYNDLINTPVIPSPQGLQDVITLDPVLTTDNTIDCGSNALTVDNTVNFIVNSTSKLSINVNGTAELSIDSQSVGMVESSGAVQSTVVVDTVKAGMQSTSGADSTSFTIAPTSVKLVTPNVNDATAIVGQFLTLTNAGSGEVEFTTLAGLPPTGAAGGDLMGTYPNPTVSHIHGIEMQSGTPTAGDVWLYEGAPAKWQHQPLPASHVTNDSAVTGSKVKDALNHLNTTKVEANAAITGATATKITYDSKGLVTAGTSLAASDMPTGINAANIGTGVVSNTEFSYLDGVTSAIQTQLNGKQATIGLTTVGTNLATLANPSAITYLRINADNTISALTLAQLKSDLSISTAILAATFTTVGTGFETVTDLSFAVTANKTYKWRATLNHFNATSASTFSITGPASPTFNVYRFTASNAATTNTVFNGTVYDTGTNAAFSSNGVTTADGMIRVISNGTVSIRIRSAAGGGISLRAGSILEFEEVL